MAKKNNIMIEYRVPEYSPEQAWFMVNGKVIAERYSQTAHNLGCMVIEGQGKEARDKIKRIVRKNRLQRRRVTFGFFKANGSREYMFTHQLTAYDDDLQDKLRIYKEWKRYCLSRNCDLATHEITSGQLTPDGMTEGTTEESHDIVDIKRPCKIKYRYEEMVV